MIGQLLLAGGAAIVVLVIAGQIAAARLRGRYRPSGRFVDMGGYRLHVDIRDGAPGPTVVLEGGTWAPALTWEPLLQRLAGVSRVVAYDRAGLGWSDRSPRPRTPISMAEELLDLLRRADVPGPYVVVGHSFGGVVARVLAEAHPEAVAGLVLLDGAHEEQFERFPPALRRMQRQMSRVMPMVVRVVGLAVRAGIIALRPSIVPAVVGPLPPTTLAAIRAQVATRPTVISTMGDETAHLETGFAEVRSLAITSLGDVPLVVVSHGRPEGVPPQLGAEVANEYEHVWQNLQVRQAGLSTRGRRIVADAAGHNIPTEAPDLVAQVVREVVAEAARPVLATA